MNIARIGLYHKGDLCSSYCDIKTRRQGWTWPNNSSVKYQNWADNEPSGLHCTLFLGPEMQWLASDCRLRYPYICELEINKTAGNYSNKLDFLFLFSMGAIHSVVN